MINCIIPSAGAASRFKDLGKAYPKSLLPYHGKPIIQHNIEKLYDQVGMFTIVVKEKYLSMYEEILGMYPTYDKVGFSIPDESKNEGPLTSVWSGKRDSVNIKWNGSHTIKNVLIVLSDIIIEDDVDLSKHFLSYQTVDDWERWCLVAPGIKLFDKPKERPAVEELWALNGLYYVSRESFDKIGDIISNPMNEETQLSYWLKDVTDLELREVKVRDFGTLEEYVNERKTPLCRHFNELKTDRYIVTKSSSDKNKIYKEYSWFQNIPDILKPYTVRTFGVDYDPFSYSMESVGHPTLREYMLFLGTENFDGLLSEIHTYIEKERSFVGGSFFSEIYSKTKTRMEGTFNQDQIDRMLSRLSQHKDIIESNTSIMHGDMVGSNIFYDEKLNEIKLIDPKGDLYGSFLYDLAKLNQTFTTPYDYIDGGLYVANYIYRNHQHKYREQWDTFLYNNYREFLGTIEVLTDSLMCSLIPLHSDTPKNQKLYKEWCDDILL